LLTRSGLRYPEVSSKFYHDSFCQLGSSISLPWVIYFDAFYLHVVSSFPCFPVICPKLVLFLTPLQFVHLLCNLPKYILLFNSCISSLLLSFFWAKQSRKSDFLTSKMKAVQYCQISVTIHPSKYSNVRRATLRYDPRNSQRSSPSGSVSP